jgi:hypothetical protein
VGIFQHAAKRMMERNMPVEVVRDLIQEPDFVVAQGPKWVFAKSFPNRPDNSVAAVLVERKEKDLWVVLTVMINYSHKVIGKHKKSNQGTKAQEFPIVSIDEDSDFASIKLAPGIEAQSYLKDGILFSENAKGHVIELQILNLSLTTTPRRKKPRKAG